MKKDKKSSRKKKNGNGLTEKRGDETRQKILAAARKVFAAHPYNAASIRMIAAKGDFYHGLIRYHFPNKADIFEAVVEDAVKEFCNIVCGNAVAKLAQMGVQVDIAPPESLPSIPDSPQGMISVVFPVHLAEGGLDLRFLVPA